LQIQGERAHEYLQDWERKERWAEEEEPVGGEEAEELEGATDEERLETSWVSRARYV